MKYILRIVILIQVIELVLPGQGMYAQNLDFRFDLITSEKRPLNQGLSQNTIYSIIQDRQGYLWIGTWDGLNKYDGLKFTTYDKSNGLSNEVINCLLESADGNIWIGTENGLNVLNKRTGEITVFQNITNDFTSLTDNWINHLYQPAPDRMFVCTRKGVNIIDLKTNMIRSFQNRESRDRRTKSNNIRYLTFHDADFFVGTDFGLIRYNPQTYENIRYLNRPGDPQSLSHNQVNVILPETDSTLWVGTEQGLNLLNLNTGVFLRYLHQPKVQGSISHNAVKSIFTDENGQVWIGTDGGGINLFDRQTGSFSQIRNQPGNPNSLNNNRVYSIFRDKHENMWFGTFKGLHRIDRYERNFLLYTHNPSDPNTVASNLIWSFCEVKPGFFWIGSDEGISIFNQAANRFSHIPYDPENPNGLSSKRIRCMVTDDYGKIWIGYRDAGLSKYDPETGRCEHFSPSIQYYNSLGDNFVISLLKDRNGMIWAGTFNGVNVIDPKTNKIRLFQNNPDDSASISSNNVYQIIEDSKGEIWLATYDGLNRFNRRSDNFSAFRQSPGQQNGFSSNRFFSLLEDSKGNFWVGSRGGGLLLFDRDEGKFLKSYSTLNGLPNNVIYGILQDNTGELWLSTNRGLSRFNISTETFVNYDVTDGLQSSEFNALSLLKSSSGLMFFGGMNGFNLFNPDEIQRNPERPDIVISGFTLFERQWPGQIYDGDTIVLKAQDNFFSFEFSALDFTSPYRSRFAYKLENFNSDWIWVDGTRNFAVYTKVNPGDYKFRVKGASSDGVWNEEGITVTVIIRPYWYQTWIFRILAAMMVIAAIWLTVWLRYKSMQKKAHLKNQMLQIENQLLDTRQQALRLQMNPHFIFNSLNSVQSFILSKDIDQAVNYLSRFSQLMRMIMTHSAENIIPLSDEIAAITHYLEIEKLRFDNKFSYSITISPMIDEAFTGIPPMIIQPYIENAIIHGLLHKESTGKIEIAFEKMDHQIHCTITDDGIGRKKAAEIKQKLGLHEKSRGMMISKERLDFFNKTENDIYSVKITDLTDDDGNPSGTKVELFFTHHEI